VPVCKVPDNTTFTVSHWQGDLLHVNKDCGLLDGFSLTLISHIAVHWDLSCSWTISLTLFFFGNIVLYITLWMTLLFVRMYHSPMSGRMKLQPFSPHVVKIQRCSFTINVSINYLLWSRALTHGNIYFLWTERPRGKHPLDFHNEQLGSCIVCGALWIYNLPWLFLVQHRKNKTNWDRVLSY